jgi:hypothetical protein
MNTMKARGSLSFIGELLLYRPLVAPRWPTMRIAVSSVSSPPEHPADSGLWLGNLSRRDDHDIAIYRSGMVESLNSSPVHILEA